MQMTVYCINCRADILSADSDTLKSPLVGNMFTIKQGMEWDIFAPTAMGNDLICPMCGWAFHRDGTILTDQGEITPAVPVVELNEDQKVDAIFTEVKQTIGKDRVPKKAKKKVKR